MDSKFYLFFILIFFFQNFIVIGDNQEIDSLIQQVKISDDNILKCDLLNKIAYEYLDENENKAISFADEAFRLSFKLEYNNGIARSYFIKGIVNEDLCKYQKALDNLFSSLIIYKNLNDENEIAKINYYLGRICKTTGNYEKSLEYCLNALRIREKQNDFLNISDIYNTMGSIYKYLGDYDQSLAYYFKCMDIHKKHRKNGISAGIYNNIGIVYAIKGNEYEALKHYEKSLNMRRINSDTLGIASSYNNVASVFLDQEKLDSAIIFLRKSMVIKEKFGDQQSLVNVYHNIAEYYYKSKDYSNAYLYAQKTLKITKDLKLLRNTSSVYELLKDIYQVWGQFEKALEYQIKYTQLNDSILNTEKLMRIAQLATVYENELLQVENELKDQKKLFINLTIYISLTFILIVLFFIYKNLKSKFNQNKLKRINLEMEKEKLANELDTKNKELTRNIIHLAEKNELLLDLKNTLQKLKSNLKDENKPFIQSVINEMKASNNNNIWNEFEISFIDVHENFYNNLSNDHPCLTQNEKRLAAFLKLNMATREISMITKQSTHSITVARTRLRKKLGISNRDINLVSYFAKY